MNSEIYMKRVGPFEAGMFLRHKIERDELSQIPEPSAVRRKAPRLSDDERFIFDEAVSSFRGLAMPRDSALEILMQDAFRRNDKRFFEIVAQASDFADEPYQTKHGKNVLSAMRVAAAVMVQDHRFPTKGEVKIGVIGELETDAFPVDSTRWTEVFRDARLTFLDSEKQKRGKTRHGD